MASDLSLLIEDGLSNTLASLLSKEAKLEKTIRASDNLLSNQCIKIDTTFTFDKLKSSWSFFIPALTATYILNLMMGDDSEPTEDITDDTVDALNEVVSNICGGLSTTINGSAFDDLGNVQFSVEDNKKVEGDDFSTIANLFQFTISLDGKDIYFFIAFDETILPYIDTITANKAEEIVPDEEPEANEEITEADLEEEKNEEKEEEAKKENKEVPEEKKDVPKDDEKIDKSGKDETNDSDKEEIPKVSILQKLNFLKIDENLSPEDAKNAKLKKIIILIAGLLGIVILTSIILFFMGTFDPPPPPKPLDNNITKPKDDPNIHLNSNIKEKQITFTINKINVKRLNRKLILLTKYEILEEDAIEKLKKAEKEKQYLDRQRRLELFAKMNKEESLFNKTKSGAKVTHQNKYITEALTKDKNRTIKTIQEEIVLDSFVQIPPLKLRKFQTFIKTSKKFHANLSICKNQQGRTLIFIGPFLDDKTRDKIIKTIDKKLVKFITKITLPKEEFEKKCKF